ncbi:hypothetical protein CLOBOL_00106 [Enterocloster bolteae ATCC BAA-613]|uniref:Uncharacterized protein n=1 Tax=Enterocloster bolteae (strain ATCC BAA-613 / DSM 15670 / CCUG 46953 / JCM 12243 / WAL 16351) TaxID=411902 RepID=A8RGC7_ENTBW|nr:hypothetical protein CLOBOL_00106 [Enterocloster bolteae ATCC BAA-613]
MPSELLQLIFRNYLITGFFSCHTIVIPSSFTIFLP